MMWLLDTNVCIRYLNGRSPSLRIKLDAVDPISLCVCSVVKAELYFGAAGSSKPELTQAKQNLFFSRFSSFAFDDIAALEYGRIRSDLSKGGQLIGPNDLMIAAICLANDLTIVTHNVSEFSRVKGLKLEDWESE